MKICLLTFFSIVFIGIFHRADCADGIVRISLKSEVNIQQASAYEKNGSIYSPFDYDLRPEVWQFQAFVGNPRTSDKSNFNGMKASAKRGKIITFSLEIDSADTWIREEAYRGFDSTTFVANTSETFTSTDLFGKVTGYVAQDDMNIFGSDFIFVAQRFGMVQNAVDYKPTWKTNGKLGLAWPRAGSTELNGSLINSLEPLKRFTISFDQVDRFASYALFGAANCQDCLDFWTTVPLRGELGYWQIRLNALELDNEKATRLDIVDKQQLAMLSNRVQLIYGPGTYIDELAILLRANREIDGKERIWYSVDCAKVDGLPYILFNLENDEYLTLAAKDYVKKSNGICVLLFAPIQNIVGENYAKNVDWILGLPLLRRYCQLYDIENREIGFARAQQFGLWRVQPKMSGLNL